jgi:hypothetical protein
VASSPVHALSPPLHYDAKNSKDCIFFQLKDDDSLISSLSIHYYYRRTSPFLFGTTVILIVDIGGAIVDIGGGYESSSLRLVVDRQRVVGIIMAGASPAYSNNWSLLGKIVRQVYCLIVSRWTSRKGEKSRSEFSPSGGGMVVRGQRSDIMVADAIE